MAGSLASGMMVVKGKSKTKQDGFHLALLGFIYSGNSHVIAHVLYESYLYTLRNGF